MTCKLRGTSEKEVGAALTSRQIAFSAAAVPSFYLARAGYHRPYAHFANFGLNETMRLHDYSNLVLERRLCLDR